jgi:CRISPR/Cas system-associated exonuclease Cas4 (RecB family)
MNSILSSLNLLDNSIFLTLSKDNRKDRGYHNDSLLTGQYLFALNNGIGPLSISDIADKYCNTGVELYLQKGKNRQKYKLKKKEKHSSSGLGKLIEDYIISILDSPVKDENSYHKIIDKDIDFFSKFEQEKLDTIAEINENESESDNKFRTQKVLNGINCCSRYEFIFSAIHKYFHGEGQIVPQPIISLSEENKALGLSRTLTPDFLVKYGETTIIGDIKTGEKFEEFHKLTCTGYALAFENQNKVDVNYGIIYFIPTMIKQAKSKNHFFFPQIHIFEIDSSLRSDFIAQRDSKYDLLSNDNIPEFPVDDQHCLHACKWRENCLELKKVRKQREDEKQQQLEREYFQFRDTCYPTINL